MGNLCEIYNGIQTGNDKKYVSTEKKSDKWHKVITGSDINRFYKSWGGKYVYYVPEKLHSNTRKDIFKCKEKIIIRQTSDRIMGAYDDEQYFTLASTFVIKQFEPKISYRCLLGILNSTLFFYLYRNVNLELGRVLPQIKKKHIFDFPIYIPNLYSEKEKKLYNEIIQTVDYILSIYKQCGYPLLPNQERKVKSLEQQIDQKVYELYGLTDEEIALVERNVK